MSTTTKHPKLWMLLPLLLGIIILAYPACRKQSSNTSDPNSFIEIAKDWFQSEIVQKEQEMLATPFTTLPRNSYSRTFARMEKLGALLDWQEAKEYERSNLQYIVVAVKQDRKPFNNKSFEAARAFVFFKNSSGQMSMNIVEVLSFKDKALGTSLHDIVSIAFSNKHLNLRSTVNNLSASIIFYDTEYKTESSYQFSNGSWAKAKISVVNKRGSTAVRRVASTMGQRTTCQTCTTWYLIGFWYDTQTGQVIDYTILDQWDECTDGPPYGDDGSGGNSGGDEDCLNNCIETSNNLSEVQVDSETVGYDIGTIDQLTKYKNPKWRILKNLTWSLYSQENGVVKLVDPDTDKWQWESLTHGPITKEGFSIGGSVTYSQGVGTVSFTPGTQNILYAGMSLNFEVTYAPICNCPGVTDVIPPYTQSYTSNAIWSAKP